MSGAGKGSQVRGVEVGWWFTGTRRGKGAGGGQAAAKQGQGRFAWGKGREGEGGSVAVPLTPSFSLPTGNQVCLGLGKGGWAHLLPSPPRPQVCSPFLVSSCLLPACHCSQEPAPRDGVWQLGTKGVPCLDRVLFQVWAGRKKGVGVWLGQAKVRSVPGPVKQMGTGELEAR